MHGKAYEFIAVTHAFCYCFFYLDAFWKFFHIIQRPAQIGAHIYKKLENKRNASVQNKPERNILHNYTFLT